MQAVTLWGSRRWSLKAGTTGEASCWGGLEEGQNSEAGRGGEQPECRLGAGGGMWAAAVAPVQGSTRERGAGEAQGLHLEASLLPQPHLGRLKDRDGSAGVSFLSAT